ncbi:MAG: hypothetical protein HZA58_04675 [Acidimicrobiia bacterium]|nr:hypothetical protein [Acidimicrobiia bacterium]
MTRHRWSWVLLVVTLALSSQPAGATVAPARGNTFEAGAAAEVPGEFVVDRVIAFVDDDGVLWFKVFTATPWGSEPPSEWFSDYVQLTVLQSANSDPAAYFGFQTHAGVAETFSGAGQTQGPPIPGYLMDDGALLFNSGLVYAGGDLAVNSSSGYLPTEGGQFEGATGQFPFRAADVAHSDDPLHFDGETPVYDLLTGEVITPPVVATTTLPATVETTATTIATTVTTAPATVERPTTAGESSETCWWCWGAVGLFAAALFCLLWTHLKGYEWWACWIPWFIVVFAWVPFLLAGLWWWRPAWWWLPLLAWFPIVGGYTWYWARRRSWWRPWHFAVVVAYLAALVVGMVVVAAPEWGLLFPLFWLPWVGLWFWYRGRRRAWFRPWMWGLGTGYVVWVLWWVAVLTPWWAWWLPAVFAGTIWWWFAANHHPWSDLGSAKWSWVMPFTLLPFLAWWIPLWEPWWCVVIALALALCMCWWMITLFRHDDWWSGWLVWFIVGFVWVPFLLGGLWFFQPWWWGWALAPWFLVIPGGAYWWASRRPWWDASWMWYAVAGYLVLAGGAAFIVGAPEWAVFFPLFWAPWVGLWFWFRGRHQAWFRPWMWGLGLGYLVWVIWWVAALTPSWGWWFPIVFLPFLGWWFTDRGYGWDLARSKACFIVPWSLLPWLGFMVIAECVVESGCCR